MSYLRQVRFSNLDEVARVIEWNLESNESALLFSDFPVEDDDEIIGLASKLGDLSGDGIKSQSNRLRKDIVHVVEDRGTLVLDPFGNQITSTTSKELDLHTDEYFSDSPSQIVFLACERPAKRGGESFVVSLTDILIHLDGSAKEILQTTCFPCQAGCRPLLTEGAFGMEIRFNMLELNRAKAMDENVALSEIQIEACHEFLRAAKSNLETFSMKNGDLLVLNNRLSLHGRTEFQKGDQRRIKRVRIKL